jgi:hypothetical protein
MSYIPFKKWAGENIVENEERFSRTILPMAIRRGCVTYPLTWWLAKLWHFLVHLLLMLAAKPAPLPHLNKSRSETIHLALSGHIQRNHPYPAFPEVVVYSRLHPAQIVKEHYHVWVELATLLTNPRMCRLSMQYSCKYLYYTLNLPW